MRGRRSHPSRVFPWAGTRPGSAAGCEEVEDPLFADVLVLGQGDERIALAALDVVNIEERWGRRMREGIGQRLGLPPERVVVLASHTHFGPATGAGSSVPITEEKHRRWADRTVQAVVDASAQADASRRPVTLHVGRRDVSPMVYNRRLRRPDGTCCMVLRLPLPPDEEGLTFGPIEPNLTLLRFDDGAGKPVLYLVSAAIHPVIGGGNFYGISADYPGVLREALERAGARRPSLPWAPQPTWCQFSGVPGRGSESGGTWPGRRWRLRRLRSPLMCGWRFSTSGSICPQAGACLPRRWPRRSKRQGSGWR